METPRWKRVKSLFEAALDEALEDRPGFLDRACAGASSIAASNSDLTRFQPVWNVAPALTGHDAAK